MNFFFTFLRWLLYIVGGWLDLCRLVQFKFKINALWKYQRPWTKIFYNIIKQSNLFLDVEVYIHIRLAQLLTNIKVSNIFYLVQNKFLFNV